MKYNVNHLVDVDPVSVQHPVDRKVTEQIRKSTAFCKIMDILGKNGVERMLMGLYSSTYLRLTPKLAPKIFEMVDEACEIFGVDVTPEIFLMRTYDMKATLLGVHKPILIISTELLAQMDDQMLWAMIASEIAATKTGYCEIRTVDYMIDAAAGLIPDALALSLKTLITQWRKYAQMSFDRSMLLASGDFNAAMRVVLCGETGKEALKNTNFADPNCGYMQQCRQFASNDDSKILNVARDISSVLDSQVYSASRYLELYEFYQNEYHDLVEEYEG